METESRVNGTLIWYYHICKRQVWLMSHSIVPDQENNNIEIGRFIHEKTYKRDNKEVKFGNVRFDVVYNNGEELIIGETKKTSKFREASRMQLLYYLDILNKSGLNASGILLYPDERKNIKVEYNEEHKHKLAQIVGEIEDIAKLDKAPSTLKNKYCGKCGYNEYCYS